MEKSGSLGQNGTEIFGWILFCQFFPCHIFGSQFSPPVRWLKILNIIKNVCIARHQPDFRTPRLASKNPASSTIHPGFPKGRRCHPYSSVCILDTSKCAIIRHTEKRVPNNAKKKCDTKNARRQTHLRIFHTTQLPSSAPCPCPPPLNPLPQLCAPGSSSRSTSNGVIKVLFSMPCGGRPQ